MIADCWTRSTRTAVQCHRKKVLSRELAILCLNFHTSVVGNSFSQQTPNSLHKLKTEIKVSHKILLFLVQHLHSVKHRS